MSGRGAESGTPTAGASNLSRALEEARAGAVARALFACLDVGEFEGARRLLAGSVDVDYVSLWGGAPRSVPADDLVDGWRRMIPTFDAVRHDLGDLRSAVGGSQALVSVSAMIVHVLGPDRWTISGQYHVGLLRRPNWRISSLTFRLEREEGDRRLLRTTTRGAP